MGMRLPWRAARTDSCTASILPAHYFPLPAPAADGVDGRRLYFSRMAASPPFTESTSASNRSTTLPLAPSNARGCGWDDTCATPAGVSNAAALLPGSADVGGDLVAGVAVLPPTTVRKPNAEIVRPDDALPEAPPGLAATLPPPPPPIVLLTNALAEATTELGPLVTLLLPIPATVPLVPDALDTESARVPAGGPPIRLLLPGPTEAATVPPPAPEGPDRPRAFSALLPVPAASTAGTGPLPPAPLLPAPQDPAAKDGFGGGAAKGGCRTAEDPSRAIPGLLLAPTAPKPSPAPVPLLLPLLPFWCWLSRLGPDANVSGASRCPGRNRPGDGGCCRLLRGGTGLAAGLVPVFPLPCAKRPAGPATRSNDEGASAAAVAPDVRPAAMGEWGPCELDRTASSGEPTGGARPARGGNTGGKGPAVATEPCPVCMDVNNECGEGEGDVEAEARDMGRARSGSACCCSWSACCTSPGFDAPASSSPCTTSVCTFPPPLLPAPAAPRDSTPASPPSPPADGGRRDASTMPRSRPALPASCSAAANMALTSTSCSTRASSFSTTSSSRFL